MTIFAGEDVRDQARWKAIIIVFGLEPCTEVLLAGICMEVLVSLEAFWVKIGFLGSRIPPYNEIPHELYGDLIQETCLSRADGVLAQTGLALENSESFLRLRAVTGA